MKEIVNQVISIHYTLKDAEKNILESTNNQRTLQYIPGTGAVMSSLEDVIAKNQVGDKFSIVLSPEEAYGIRDEVLVKKVSKSYFTNSEVLAKDRKIVMHTNNGNKEAIILKVFEEDVLVDLNDPMAGKFLYFDIEIVAIREATDEEIAHGHVH